MTHESEGNRIKLELPEHMHVHVHYVDVSRIERILSEVLFRLRSIQGQGVRIMALIDDLEAEVTAQTDVGLSVKTLIEGLIAALTAAGNDPVRIQAVIDKMKSNKQVLIDAVLAGTPAAPTA